MLRHCILYVCSTHPLSRRRRRRPSESRENPRPSQSAVRLCAALTLHFVIVNLNSVVDNGASSASSKPTYLFVLVVQNVYESVKHTEKIYEINMSYAVCVCFALCVIIASVLSAPIQPVENEPCQPDKLTVYKVVLHTFWSREKFPKHYPDWRPPAQWSKVFGEYNNIVYICVCVCVEDKS